MKNNKKEVSVPQASIANKRLLSMGTAYAIGTFNDNFFKQAALFLAGVAQLQWLQGMATTLFALPFVLFSAWAGWFADSFEKRTIIIKAKYLELFAMFLGLFVICSDNWYFHWYGMVAVVCLMGIQSTLFSPALNGAIPENFAAKDVPRVNAILKLVTTVTILLGFALGGIVLEFPVLFSLPENIVSGNLSFGRFSVGIIASILAVAGVLSAYAITSKSRVATIRNPFPFLGPLDSLRHAVETFTDQRKLFWAICAEGFFYGCSSFVILCINNLGINQLAYSMTKTSFISVSLMFGVAFGALLGARFNAMQWKKILPLAGIGMGAGLMCIGLVLASFPLILVLFALCGICGGIYLIPIVSFIQIRPKAHEKGKILGISNFGSFSGILLSGMIFSAFGKSLPSDLIFYAGLSCLVFIGILILGFLFVPEENLEDVSPGLLGYILRFIIGLRYSVTVKGLDKIRNGDSILFLPNHPALIDPIIIYSQLSGLHPRTLADENRMNNFLGRIAAKLIRAILIPDALQNRETARKGIEAGLQRTAAVLEAGDSVLLYPSGRIYRSARENLGANYGTAELLHKLPQQRVVLVRTSGLWGSSFGYTAKAGNPDFIKTLLCGIRTIFVNLIFLTPRRKVNIEFIEPKDLPRDGDRKKLNTWLEEFYNQAERPAVGVPRYFWQGCKPFALPEPDLHTQADTSGVTRHIREAVYAAIRKNSGLSAEIPIFDAQSLNRDLGLDSLALMVLALELEEIDGKSVSNLENLNTVGDCVLAAAGVSTPTITFNREKLKAWFAPVGSTPLSVPDNAGNIADAFVYNVCKAPKAAMLAEYSGLRTRREVLTVAIIIAEHFKKITGERIGIMLPATIAAVPVWLAAQLAGKVPVFLNWTVGASNLLHCIKLARVSEVVTAGALLDRLERQGENFESLPVEWIKLEKLAAGFSLTEKIRGAFKARFMRSAKSFSVPNCAAVLFTSGSESLPKAVPLSHKNLLSNAQDIIDTLKIKSDASILAMLPTFHSFGLMVNIVLPLALGLRAAFYPNPTEAENLKNMVRDFKLSLLASPPTFLAAMLERVTTGTELESLRYAFVGAEKCPEHVYKDFGIKCQQASLCEGYGITECAPVVSVNVPGQVVMGSIGLPLPSVEIALVNEVDGEIIGEVTTPGQAGMLLVRGPNIFAGYLGDAPSPFVEYAGKQWYRTGDLVSRGADGILHFQGRLKRFIKIGGEMISLPQIESVLLEMIQNRLDLPAEGPALAVEAAEDEHKQEIILFSMLPLDLSEVNAYLRQSGLSGLYSVRKIMLVESIPLLGSGKTDYRALKALLAEQK